MIGLCCIAASVDDGPFVQYYKKHLITKGALENGARNGIWSFFYPNSSLHFQGSFNNDLKQGEWAYYNEKEALVTKATYQNGQLHGAKTFFNSAGQISAVEFYENNHPNGRSDFYSEEGLLKASLEQGAAIRNFQAYHPNGKLRFETIDWKNKKNDTTYVFYDNGQTKESLVFYKNILLSIGATYNEAGESVDNGNFKNGAGKVIRYYDDLKPFSVCMYSAGLKSGIGQLYYPNGQIKEAGLFSKGAKTGVWKYYSIEGELIESIEHRGEVKDDEFVKAFSPDGLEIAKQANVPEFPGGSKSFNKYLKAQFENLDYPKGEKVTVTVDLDEFGFVKDIEVFSADNKKQEDLSKAVQDFPRCIPAFNEGVPETSTLVQVYRF